jgi:hypothetical protein
MLQAENRLKCSGSPSCLKLYTITGEGARAGIIQNLNLAYTLIRGVLLQPGAGFHVLTAAMQISTQDRASWFDWRSC